MKRVLAAIWGSLAIVAAHAASFDCAQAESRAEKLICASPSLSALDEKLASAFGAARSAASKDQQQRLITAQRLWIKTARDHCADEACLATAYAARISHLVSAPALHAGEAPFVQANTLANHPAPIGKGFPELIRPIDGDLVYSHYDDNGNTRSIVQFDFTNGHWTNLVSGKTDPALIAQDARYIVLHTPYPASFPIEVINRKTGAVLGKIRLANPVLGAFIQGNRLVLFQGQTGAYTFQQAVAILALPSLKLIQETTVPGFRLIGSRGDRIYTATSASGKNDLMVFDHQLRELGRIQIPPPLEKINANCELSVEQADNDNAVLTANCGEMHVVDLKSFSIVQSIPRYAHFYSMALHGGLIFTTATDKSTGADGGVVVFDMGTGKEVARLPISASTIAIKGDILLAAGSPVSTGNTASWHMETYRINADALRNGAWQEARVVQQCRQAEAQLADSKDLYAAIGLCKQAGIEGFARDASVSAAVFPALRQYGLWLSQTLDECPNAVRILEKVQAANPDPDVAHALNEARLKAQVVSGEVVVELSQAERQTDFAQVLVNGEPLANTTTKNLEFGAFPELFHFSGDRLYVGRYGCRTTRCGGGATIGVFDRNTLDELASIQIAPNDEEYQDAIGSIAADDRHIYASVGYQYEQEGRPNFFVVDRATLRITKRAQAKSIGLLHIERGKLMACGCHFTQQQACAELDPDTLKSTETPDKACVQSEPGNETIVTVDRKMVSDAKFFAATRDYLVAGDEVNSDAGYVFYPRAGGQPLPPVRGLGDALEWPVSVDGNDIVIRQGTLGGQLIKLVSLPSGAVQTLLGLPVTPLRVPVPMLHEQTLYVGYGRDLLIYDLSARRLNRYIKDFIPGEFKNNGFGLDAHRITRLMIDQGRLIALTFHGVNSQIIRLSDL
ncbi:lysozyme inhibitor LprI family protein [uncultured Ralstonia sp.]|jgi:uncharacterized protein YecT (DUF1311 family)|uniref:lysozyme inhibitor LprI family protein n=1 Tax=Ralstonia sp. TaxID=54061 RepID=UPI0025F0FCE2|nr:lysozyme inhibitor LprI family protein [uncultured Ralstonia sp.]